MGMIVNIYRNSLGDCTNGGMSKAVDRLCIVNCEGPFEPSEEQPAAILELSKHGTLRIMPAERWTAIPRGYRVKQGWFMNGGNFGSTSDDRFCQLVVELGGQRGAAIPIFDRQEN